MANVRKNQPNKTGINKAYSNLHSVNYQSHLLLILVFVGLSCRTKTTNEQVVSHAPTICQATASIQGIDALPTPKFRENIGNSSLVVTTRRVEAQKWFNQGLNHLHGFWHLEAYRCFKQVIRLDSTCAMGYWGIAMCQPGFGGSDNRWANAINKAVSLMAALNPLEKDLLVASQILVTQGPDAAFGTFKKLTQQYPNEPEILAFAGIILRQSNNDMRGAVGNEIKQLLKQALKKFPQHVALQHYYIHLLELRPDFGEAVGQARAMIQTAKNSPHLRHMPGHLYYLAGNYTQATQAYEIARKQEEDYHQTEKIPFSANQNYIHNLHFLAVCYAELNEKEKALAAAKSLANTTLSVEIPNEGAAQMLLYEGRILPALVHIRFREWERAHEQLSFWLNTPDFPITNLSVRTYLQAMQAYCLGMQAISTGQEGIDTASQQGAILSRLMSEFEQMGMQRQGTPEFKSINETYDLMSMARYELAGWIDNINPQRPFNDMAWKEAFDLERAIQYDEPPRLMYPVAESLGRLHQYRNENAQAKQAFARALKVRAKSPIVLSLMK